MSFVPAKRTGKNWEDMKKLDDIIQNYPFHLTCKNEREFEQAFASNLISRKKDFNGEIITQVDKTTTLKSVYCFGKSHRPDMAIGEKGIGIELKFINDDLDGLKKAIGQSHIYRLQYRFVANIFIIDEKHQSTYEGIKSGMEKDLEDTLKHLANDTNIFSYIVPTFTPKPGVDKCFSYFEKTN